MDNDIDMSELSFADSLVDSGDAEVGYSKTLIYGAPGVGKTRALVTMPDPIIIFLTERHGDRIIKDTAAQLGKKVKIMYLENKKDPLTGKMISAREKMYKALDELGSKRHPFRSLGLDSLTDMQQVMKLDMQGGVAERDFNQKEWGQLINLTGDVAMKLRNLNMHVTAICLSSESQDEGQRMIYRPTLYGKKLPANIVQYFNLCCFQRKEYSESSGGDPIYCSVFEAGDQYYTKSHPALLPVESPDIGGWIEKISQYCKKRGLGDAPEESFPIENHPVNLERKIKERVNQPQFKELFDKVNTPEGKRLAAARKYPDDGDLLDAVKRVVAAQEKDDKKSAEREKGKAKPSQESQSDQAQ